MCVSESRRKKRKRARPVERITRAVISLEATSHCTALPLIISKRRIIRILMEREMIGALSKHAAQRCARIEPPSDPSLQPATTP